MRGRLEMQAPAVDTELKRKRLRGREAERIGAGARRIRGDGKSTAATGANQAIDIGGAEHRQVGR